MAVTRADTYDKVIQIITEKLNTDRESIGNASTFEALGADSLDMVEIVMKLEEAFGVEIDDQDAEKLVSIDQVVDYIHERRSV
jgi:acyl carrier protein